MGLELGSDGTFKILERNGRLEIGWKLFMISGETRFLQDGRWPDSSQFA